MGACATVATFEEVSADLPEPTAVLGLRGIRQQLRQRAERSRSEQRYQVTESMESEGEATSHRPTRQRRLRARSQPWSQARWQQLQRRADRQIHAKLTRPAGDPLGLRLQHGMAGVLIRQIEENSAITTWNKAHPGKKIRSGDLLVSVNDVTANSSWDSWCAILAELRKSSVQLVVLRAPSEELARYWAHAVVPPGLDHLLPGNFMDLIPHVPASECGLEECSICLEALAPEARVVRLPCRHAFHHGCAEEWLTRCPTFKFARCPMCRQQLAQSFWSNEQEPQMMEMRSV